jgi:pimeloyl-ACP methyl ester carboxylesterase
VILVRDLKEFIGHLGLADFDLGGFSLGARTTIEAVLGGLVPRRAILAGTGLDVLTNWERRSHFYIEAIDRFDSVSRGDPHWLAVQFMKTMKVDREAVRLLLGTMRDREDKAALVEAFAMPTLVVCGTDDPSAAPDESRKIASRFPNGSYDDFPGAKHLPNVEQPEAFNRVLLKWVTSRK